MLFKPGDGDTALQSGNIPDKQPLKSAVPVIESSAQEEAVVKKEVEIKTVIKYVPVKVYVNADEVKETPLEEVVQSAESAVIEKSLPGTGLIRINESPAAALQRNLTSHSLIKTNTIPIIEPDIDGSLNSWYDHFNIFVELRGTQSWDLTETNISPAEYQKFNDLAATVFWGLTDELLVGGEYRRENFYQEFEGKIKNGDLYLFKQNPNLVYGGISVRYRPEWFASDKLRGFGQISAGGTTVGPLLRLMLGGEYSVGDNMRFVFGIEGSDFWYQHQATWWNSQKIGAHYGISYRVY
jgi:hypothetical protein